jgi:metal-responsive CopG/Arc/MetJ family transcriptional regulator
MTPAVEEKQPQLIHMLMDKSLLKRLDDFRFKHRMESRSEAARALMKLALDNKLAPKSVGSNSRA